MRLTVAAGAATVLASIALYPLLAGASWFWGGIGAVIVAGAVGAATWRRAIPVGLCLLAAAAGEFLYFNVLFAHDQSWAGLVPTGSSVHHLGVLVAQATAEISKDAPPVPAAPGVVLLTVAGIGLVGVLTDVLAVRLHRPAIAGLPLLVLFCVPLTTYANPGAVGAALVFCAGMVGYLGLLSADGAHRLRLWGRIVHPWQDESGGAGPDTRALAAVGRRIGSAAVVLALAVPLLAPGLRAHPLFPGTGGAGGGGLRTPGLASFPRPLVVLNTDLHEPRPLAVLSYRATDQGPPPYLQLYVLSNLGAGAWTMARPTDTRALGSRGTMPGAPGLAAATPAFAVHQAMTLAPGLPKAGNASYLPLPYPARQVRVRGDWRVDLGSLTVHGTGPRLAGLRYTVDARDPHPSPQQLRRAGSPLGTLAADTVVPGAFDGLRQLAEQHTAGRTTAYGKAVALQNWFTRTGHFTYSLNAGQGAGPTALAQFLTKTKRGSCQQFAFGMAVLARLLGIPARVVVGFTQGTFVGNQTWQVTTSDAHAWPELYFTGVGWLRFEPTPPNLAGPAGQGTATIPAYTQPQPFAGGIAPHTRQNTTHPAPAATNSAGAKLPGKLGNIAPSAGAGSASKPAGSAPIAALVIALLAVMLATPRVSWVLSRRWRWRKAHDHASRAHVAWRELRDDLTDHRIACRASESPRALARRIAGLLSLTGAERDALERVAHAAERANYAASPADSARLQADTVLIRRAVARASGPAARWSARIVPSSALAPLRAGLQHLLDVFGWADPATTKARNRSLRHEKAAQAAAR